MNDLPDALVLVVAQLGERRKSRATRRCLCSLTLSAFDKGGRRARVACCRERSQSLLLVVKGVLLSHP